MSRRMGERAGGEEAAACLARRRAHLVHLLRLLNAQADGAAKVLHEHLRLLHLGRKHLGAHPAKEAASRGRSVAPRARRKGGLARAAHAHGAKRHLRPQLLRNAQRQRRLARARRARQQQRPASARARRGRVTREVREPQAAAAPASPPRAARAPHTHRPAIFLDRMSSTTMPAASRARSWPTRPAATATAVPASSKPRPAT